LEEILIAVNISAVPQSIPLHWYETSKEKEYMDLITNRTNAVSEYIQLDPYQVMVLLRKN